MLLGVVLPKNSHLLKGSVAAPHLISLARQSLGLLPPDFKQRLNDYLKEWRRPREMRQAEEFRPREDRRAPGPGRAPANPWGSGPGPEAAILGGLAYLDNHLSFWSLAT